jgi:hypothetical protein
MNVNITLKDHLHDDEVTFSNTGDRNMVDITIENKHGLCSSIVLEVEQIKLALRKLSAR